LRNSSGGPPICVSTTSRSPSPSMSQKPRRDRRWIGTVGAGFFRWHGHETRAFAVTAVPEQLSGLAVLLVGLDGLISVRDGRWREHVEPAVEVVIEEKRPNFKSFWLAGPTPAWWLRRQTGVNRAGRRRARSFRWRSCRWRCPVCRRCESGGINAHRARTRP